MTITFRARLARLALLAGCSILALGGSARAQGMNYGELEQLFDEPVTKSATGKPQRASDAPADIVIVTQDEIRRSGADNLPDILQFVTGIDVRRHGFASADVSPRGLNSALSPRLLVLVNGRQVYEDDFGYTAWQSIPVELDEIRQIEVVKGPNSALFGFNAVGGVVNIITYDPLDDTTNVATGRTGTQHLGEGDVVTTVHVGDRAGLRVSAGGYLAHEFGNQSVLQGFRPDQPKRGSISADGKIRIAPGVLLTLSASDTSTDNYQQLAPGFPANWLVRLTSINAGLTADTPIGALSLNAYRNVDKTAARAPIISASWENTVYVVQAADLFKPAADHAIRIALEYRHNKDEDPFFYQGRVSYDVYAASGLWDWQITPDLSLTNALRLDYLTLGHSPGAVFFDGYTSADFNRTLLEPSFNSGVVYKASVDDTVRLTAARGVQVPSLIDFSVFTGANPTLAPEIVGNYELGWDRRIDAISSVLRAAVFYQTNDNILSVAGGSPTIITRSGIPAGISENIGSADETGFEIGIKGHSEQGLRWNLSYGFATVSEHLTSNRGPVPDTPVDYARGTPTHSVIFGGGYSVGQWEFDVEGKYQSEYRDYFRPNFLAPLQTRQISDFVTLSARVGYRVADNVTVALSGGQLAQARQIESAGLPVERRIILSATAHF